MANLNEKRVKLIEDVTGRTICLIVVLGCLIKVTCFSPAPTNKYEAWAYGVGKVVLGSVSIIMIRYYFPSKEVRNNILRKIGILKK